MADREYAASQLAIGISVATSRPGRLRSKALTAKGRSSEVTRRNWML